MLLKFRETRLRLGQQPDRPIVGRHELVQRRAAVRERADRGFQVGQNVVKLGRLHQVAVAATRPRMPLTKRPASSPEKVFASSIDSLIAALVGTLRSIAIS